MSDAKGRSLHETVHHIQKFYCMMIVNLVYRAPSVGDLPDHVARITSPDRNVKPAGQTRGGVYEKTA